MRESEVRDDTGQVRGTRAMESHWGRGNAGVPKISFCF